MRVGIVGQKSFSHAADAESHLHQQSLPICWCIARVPQDFEQLCLLRRAAGEDRNVA
jgi:hypothetical protein